MQELAKGDLLLTRDCGYQQIVVVTKISPNSTSGPKRPVRWPIQSYSGATRPTALSLSAEHGLLRRVPLDDPRTSEQEVLMPAAASADAGRASCRLTRSDEDRFHISRAFHALILGHSVWMETTATPSFGTACKATSPVRPMLGRKGARHLL